MGLPYGFVDKIAKLIPFEVGISLTKAMEQEPELKQRYESDETVRALIDLALKLEGIARSVGKHAGGVVIAPTRLIDFSPLYCEADGTSVVTQYDKKDVEEVGLVKFDFLGLRTLTIIDWAIKAINQERRKKDQPPLDISLIPLNDPLVYDQLKSANTTAVFQLESRGMKDLIRRLRPDNFEDIIALVALFRPGPLGSGMVDDFIDRKHGVAEVDYPHPDLEPVLKPTYGIILYQEQVMQVAQVLAAYSLGAADLLRRAMGKKDKEEMQRQRAQFMDGAAKHGVDPHLAGHIFDLMEKFAEYGFNKSHSAAYALVSYQTAWLKVHYAAWFMAAVLSSDMDKTEKVVTFIEECRQMKIRVRPPDINHSRYMFFASGPDEVVYGLGAIKGVGEAVIQNIVAEREQNGAYTDLFDLCKRIDLSKANRRVLESFIKAGAMDSLERNRAVLLGSLEDEIRKAEQFSRNLNTGQVDFFGFDASASQSEKVDLPVARPQKVFSWTEEERLGFEKETLGLYLTGHPFTQFEAELSSVLTHRLVDLADGEGFGSGGREGKKVRFAGLVVGIRPRILESGKKMLLISLDDRTGQFEVPLIGEALEREGNKVVKDKVLIVDATLKYDPFRERMRTQVERFYSLEQVREIFGRRLVVSVAAENVSSTLADQLEKILLPYVKGRCPVCLEYRGKSASAFLELGSEWRVKPYDELLRQLAGLGEIRLEF
jgi:DNA polymerase-3 subunit alpha